MKWLSKLNRKKIFAQKGCLDRFAEYELILYESQNWSEIEMGACIDNEKVIKSNRRDKRAPDNNVSPATFN